jgi:TPR repeat protein
MDTMKKSHKRYLMFLFVSPLALMFQNILFADLSSCLNRNSFSCNKSFSEQLKKEAEEGYTQSQYDLAACYDVGSGIKRDIPEAVKWYKKAAADGNAKAQFRLAHIFSCSAEACSKPECQKCPIKIDLKESLMWLTKAAEGGLLDAQLALGEYYAEYGSNRNDEKAEEWLKLAADKGSEKGKELLELVSSPGRKPFSKEVLASAEDGSSEDQFSIAFCYLNGEGVKKDPLEAKKWFIKVAENNTHIGDTKVRAQRKLAEMLGDYSDMRNDEESIQWYRKAAESGDITSQLKLAEILPRKNRSEKYEEDEAESWLIQAASSGSVEGLLQLGKYYLDQNDDRKNQAFAVLLKATGLGQGEAAYLIGTLYQQGKGVMKSHQEALKWFKVARKNGYSKADTEIAENIVNPPRPEYSENLLKKAMGGDSSSELDLGLAYYYGDGISPNPLEAEKWLLVSANKRNTTAQRTLAQLYAENHFSEENRYNLLGDTDEAEGWLKQAAKGGNEYAQKLLGLRSITHNKQTDVFTTVAVTRELLEPLVMKGDSVAKEALVIMRKRWSYPYSEELLKEAKDGIPEAQFDLGYAYLYGNGVDKDLLKAAEWFKSAFKNGESSSAMQLTRIYHELRNNDEESKWSKPAEEAQKKAIEESKKDRQWLLDAQAKIIEEVENSLPVNSPQLLSLAAAGDTNAQLALGIFCMDGYNINYRRVLKWLTLGASNADPESALRLGKAYIGGDYGLKKDPKDGEKYLLQAARNGSGAASTKLGLMYLKGDSVSKDDAKGMSFLQEAAVNGNVEAQQYLKESAKKTDWERVSKIQWVLAAAEQGDVEAQARLGVIYSSSPESNYEEALAWYKKAASQGNTRAMVDIGDMYKRGKGVVANLQEAFNWYSKAAEIGNGEAMSRIAHMYCNGEGLKTDRKEALSWFKKAWSAKERQDQNAKEIVDLYYETSVKK